MVHDILEELIRYLWSAYHCYYRDEKARQGREGRAAQLARVDMEEYDP